MPRRARGFTLIEMIAAFVIFSLAVGSLMQILTMSLNSAKFSVAETRAALWAQSKLDIVGVGERLKEGHSSGKFDDDYAWSLEVNRYESPDSPPNIETVQAIELYRLDLTVSWGARRPRNAHFITLRSMTPDQNAFGGAAAGAQQGGSPPPQPNAGGGNSESKE